MLKRIILTAILVSVLFLSTSAKAERYLTFGVWTEHYSGDHTEGTDNHLVALEIDGYTGAFFKNSYGKETAFFGYTFHTDKIEVADKWYIQGNLSAGALAGYGTKHPIHFGVLSPGVYPTINIGKASHSIGVGVMPTFLWLNYRYEF